jgi:uncharacterized protein YndB with AHSA1/START domain
MSSSFLRRHVVVADSIEREIVIDAPVDRVWHLLTEAEHLGRWFGDAGAEIDLRPGGTLVLRWTEHGTVHGRVERIEPQRLLSYRWAPYKSPGGLEPDDGNSTLVEFTLSAEGDGTRVRVVESGFTTLDCSEDEQAAKVEGNGKGWEIEMDDLRQHAENVTA